MVMSFTFTGRTRVSTDSLGVYTDQYVEIVGAMLYISSHLMLAIVPPISPGAVGTSPDSFVCMRSSWS